MDVDAYFDEMYRSFISQNPEYYDLCMIRIKQRVYGWNPRIKYAFDVEHLYAGECELEDKRSELRFHKWCRENLVGFWIHEPDSYDIFIELAEDAALFKLKWC